MTAYKRKRTAITLIELLVVLFIVGVIVGLGVLFFPEIEQQSRVANGAVEVQGWLNIAKSRAQRDLVPHGLRLLPNTVGNPRHITECQYIEQPDAFSGGALRTNGANDQEVFVSVDLTGGFPDPKLFPVQNGDYLEVLSSGLVHRIVQIDYAQRKLTLASKIGFPISATPDYRIHRQPRVVGEETLKMPNEVIIDLVTNQTYGSPLAFGGEGNVDILFSPTGQVIGTQAASEQILLWVRDVAQTMTEGEPTLISVRTKTGMISAYPVDLTLSNGNLVVPYAFAQEE